MKKLVIGIIVGLILGGAVAGYSQDEGLGEVQLDMGGGVGLTIPQSYGHLVGVAVSSNVHHLYFEDPAGTIRVVLVGPRGATQRARHVLQLLVPEVYTISRDGSGSS